mgnify:CR=1 FL=1
MQELKQAISELKLSYDKVTELIGPAHPVSKKVLGIIREHDAGNAHQIVKERMGQKKVQPKEQRESVVDSIKSFFKI